MSEKNRRETRIRRAPAGVKVDLMMQGEKTAGRVVALSENGVTIDVPTNGHPAPEVGSRIDGAWLDTPDGSPVQLSVTVLDVQDDGTGERRLTLAPATDSTRAVLWFAVEKLGPVGKSGKHARQQTPEFPRIPARGIYTEAARRERLNWLRDRTKAPLRDLEITRLSAERLTGNVENFIGAIEVPVGLAGPLLFHGDEAMGYIFAPFATSEGALVASATRGAKALTLAGGATTRVLKQQMMRVPMFSLSSLKGAVLFANWVRDHTGELRQQARQVSRHAVLHSIEPIVIGNMVHLYMSYETGDAAGQNMTTACTWHACQWLLDQLSHIPEIAVEKFQIEANVSGDKKVTFRSFIAGRGIRVVAECLIPAEVMQAVLKVTPEQIVRVNEAVVAGSINAGMVGFNINIANVIAAIFAATGQDIACVHESAIGQLHMQAVEGGLYTTMLLPSLIIGTVGGGTHLPAQRALLEMMDCAGAGRVVRLAEIIAGYCLALDLSTLSAVATGEFATAHERLGRNRPVHWFTMADLTPDFFSPALPAFLGSPSVSVARVEPAESGDFGASILTQLTARKVSKLVGLVPLRLICEAAGEAAGTTLDVVAKVKPLDAEIELMVNGMMAMCGPRVAAAHGRFRERTGFAGCHLRELEIYRMDDPRIAHHRPRTLLTHRDDSREAYIIVMEKLAGVALLNSADDVSGWSNVAIETAIDGIAQVHAVWLGKADELRRAPWIGHVQSAAGMVDMRELWESMADHAAQEFPEIVDRDRAARWLRLIADLPGWWGEIERHPWTLIHNDFNPRNICLRPASAPASADKWRLCAYDWELATAHLPQHDVAELLCFVTTPDTPTAAIDGFIERHRTALEAASGAALPAPDWRHGFGLALRDLAVNRLAMYLVAHTFQQYEFMPRVIATLHHLLRAYAE